MEKYYVKAPISGWKEVDKEHYERFVNTLRKGITTAFNKEELIKERTRIVTDNKSP